MMDRNLDVVHAAIEEEELIYKLQGSKYVQSSLKESFKTIRDILEKGRCVLFVGTPCQVNGLLHFLPHKYDNLYTIDFICHGVPSPKVWKKYVEELKRSYGEIQEGICSFRAKDKGWINFSIKVPVGNGYSAEKCDDPYLKAFLKNLSLRPSCYNCNSKGISRNSDITMADFWAIEKFSPELFDDKGASLIFFQSDKGKKLFETISKDAKVWEIELKKINPYITSAYHSVRLYKNRKKFMKYIEKDTLENLVSKYGKSSIVLRTKIFIVTILNKILGKKSKWEK